MLKRGYCSISIVLNLVDVVSCGIEYVVRYMCVLSFNAAGVPSAESALTLKS